MRTINDRLQELTDKIISNDVLENTGFGNEMKFRIFDYNPEDEYIIRDYINDYLIKKADNVIVIDIYDVVIEVLEELGYLQKCFEMEKEKGTEYMNNLIIDTLGIATDNDMIIDKMKEKIVPNKVIILTGLGKAYSIIRAYTVISELQSSIETNSVIIMFPGKYEDLKFKLFNIIDDDNYYDAFTIVSRK